MSAIAIHSADDPRIADYVDLSDPELRRRVESRDGFFVAEGALVVRTLLSTPHRVRSVLVTPEAARRCSPTRSSRSTRRSTW